MNDIKSINRFEANLVRLARFAVGSLSASQARPLLAQQCGRPRCLSRDAVALVQDTLGKGCVRLLARHGGWRRERFLRGNQIADGYLWQRTPPAELGLHFSRHTLELLLWLTAENVENDKASRRMAGETDSSPADVLVCYHVLAALQDVRIGVGLGKRLGLTRQSLCRLAFPREFVNQPHEPTDFARWTKGVAGCILEALQDSLADHWVALERGKRQLTDWRYMQSLGRAQETVLNAYLDALEKAGRLDLARFLLMVAVELLAPDDVRAAHWIGGLTSTGQRLADRAATLEAALVVIRQLPRLQRWERQARSVGYFDENYAASQLWKSDWEYWQGDQLCRRADVLLRELNLLAGEGPAPPE